MLTTLRIKNLALVADLTLELQPGYNAITGETGAGKSIIIGALSLVLGERADRTLIRSGADSCSVEAVFDAENLPSAVADVLGSHGLEPCEDRQLVLKRTFTTAGTNRQFINGSPTTLNVLTKLGEWLVDIHGPHDHQSLLQPARQLAILDAFGGMSGLREDFAELVRRHNALKKEKRTLIVDERTYAQQLDLLRHQAQEISAARLDPQEERQMEDDYSRARNAARLLELSQTAAQLLHENENALLPQAGTLGRTLVELQKIDASGTSLVTLQEQAVAMLGELQNELSAYTEKLELDPARLETLEERINLLHALKRKYGRTLAEVIGFGEEAEKKLASLEQRDQELERLNRELIKASTALSERGQELSKRRRKLIPKLAKAALKQLADLGFDQCSFDAAIETKLPRELTPLEGNSPFDSDVRLAADGFDEVEFQFSPNQGEPLRPLRAIASSGEIARVMLALKTVLASEDEIPVLVFDEVDANVGGETAQAVGEKMRQIGEKRQVLCITHLAHVAAAAATHYRVGKEVREGRTISRIHSLSPKERIDELARMLGGANEAARKHAQTLLIRG